MIRKMMKMRMTLLSWILKTIKRNGNSRTKIMKKM
jgi:hypothetical protein